MKRVYTLYRVSTKGQLDVNGNDIPMQQIACREFANNHPDWEIVHEVIERGVSGYSLGAEERDGLQEIIRDATAKKYDILLVFKFDRLGRKYNETPFILENLVDLGIEVWSATEGQQTINNGTDSLINFMRFWQANMESANTSIRTKTAIGQLAAAGLYTGGTPPYGYVLENKGRTNKKGQPVKDPVIDETQAMVVREIFDYHVNYGYGIDRITGIINEKGYLTRTGNTFVPPSVRNILKNIMYTGRLKCREIISEPVEDIRIIDDFTFNKSQEIMKQRTVEHRNLEESRVPSRIEGENLLIGLLFCGSCGSRIMGSSTGARTIKGKDGKGYKKRYRQYVCYLHSRYKDKCKGRSSYRSHLIEDVVIGLIKEFFDRVKSVPMSEVASVQHKREIGILKSRLADSTKVLTKVVNDISYLNGELVDVIKGESSFSRETLAEAIDEAKRQKEEAEKNMHKIENDLANSEERLELIMKDNERLLSYAEVFEQNDPARKRMVIGNLINRITLFGDKIDIEWNITVNEYFEGVNEIISKAS